MFKKSITATAILLASGTAFAASYDFNMLDTDKDGVISKTEAANSRVLIEYWDQLDKDGNNTLNSDEFKAASQL